MQLAVFWDHMKRAAQQQGVPVQEMLRKMRAMGYTLAEMDFSDVQADPTIPEQLKQAGMGISSLYCFFDFVHGREEALCRALVDTALVTGTKRIMPIPGFYTDADPVHNAAEREQMLEGMRGLCALAEENGLTVTIEDFDGETSPIRDSEGMAWFIERIPNLHATYDTGNFRFCGDPEMDAFARLEKEIRHVHLKDRKLDAPENGNPKIAMDGVGLYPCAVGEGFIPMQQIFAGLKRIGYDGVLSVEHFDAADHLRLMSDSAAYVKQNFTIIE